MGMKYTFKNLGNMCFFNTALQLLCSLSLDIPTSSSSWTEFQNLFHKRSEHGKNLYERYLRTYKMNSNSPEDCSECICRLLDMFHDEMKSTDTMSTLSYWKEIGESVIRDQFYGLYKVDKFQTCCERVTTSYEMFTLFTIFQTNTCSNTVDMFQESLNSHREDRIADVHCDDCGNQHAILVKQYTILRLPKILIFHFVLPRNGFVAYPYITINGTETYALKFACFYTGGHYFSLSYDRTENAFYVVSDEQILSEKIQTIPHLNDVQMLCYEKK